MHVPRDKQFRFWQRGCYPIKATQCGSRLSEYGGQLGIECEWRLPRQGSGDERPASHGLPDHPSGSVALLRTGHEPKASSMK